ncbi:MAG: chromosomal replication initiator protein DnaA [Caldisericota bacterium]|nr:chromosomal replication initiator protein DnaA [Caldisericota bacterium]
MNIWKKALNELKEHLSVPTFETWFRKVELEKETANTVTLNAPSEFVKEWLETKYKSLIESTLSGLKNKDVKVEIVVGKRGEEPPQKIVINNLTLKKRYSFENFVVGGGNKLAYAASTAVAKNPGTAYNPLYIYGGVGLGKTHLLQAISHYLLKNFSDLKIIYTTTEKFTNEVIYAIQNARSNSQLIDRFHKQYRSVDVLLIDDIQFLAGKERTQEEFFHTFNSLHDAGKQVVITSDCLPKEIATLQERLLTRFEWGLVADIQPPDFETRVAILKKKAELENISVPDDVLFYTAKNIFSNIRELEGALVRLVASASLTNEEITLSFATKILSSVIQTNNEPITIKRIKKVVSEYFNTPGAALDERKRSQDIVIPRQIAMYLARQLTDSSLPLIGSSFGGRDHTTVMHACAKIGKEAEKQETMKALIEDITKKIKTGN